MKYRLRLDWRSFNYVVLMYPLLLKLYNGFPDGELATPQALYTAHGCALLTTMELYGTDEDYSK